MEQLYLQLATCVLQVPVQKVAATQSLCFRSRDESLCWDMAPAQSDMQRGLRLPTATASTPGLVFLSVSMNCCLSSSLRKYSLLTSYPQYPPHPPKQWIWTLLLALANKALCNTYAGARKASLLLTQGVLAERSLIYLPA